MYIYYYNDQEEKEYIFTKDSFIENIYMFPTYFILEQMDKYSDIRKDLSSYMIDKGVYDKLSRIQIKENDNYKDIVKNVIMDNNINTEINLVLYYENDLLNILFNDKDYLIEEIVKKDSNNKVSEKGIKDLAKLSKLIDKKYNKRIIKKVKYLYDKYYEDMLEFDKELMMSIVEDKKELKKTIKKRKIKKIKKIKR